MELKELLKVILKNPVITDEILSFYSLESTIEVNRFNWYFVVCWNEAEHTSRHSLIVVHDLIIPDNKSPELETLWLPIGPDVIPILHKIADLCKVRSEVDELMRKIGYPDKPSSD